MDRNGSIWFHLSTQSYRPIRVHLVPNPSFTLGTPWNSLKDPWGSTDPTLRTTALGKHGGAGLFEASGCRPRPLFHTHTADTLVSTSSDLFGSENSLIVKQTAPNVTLVHMKLQ